MSKKLTMSFTTTGGNKTSMTVEDPKDSLDASTVRTAMENLIAVDVFHKAEGDDLAAIKGASIVETTETVLI